jgi:hypothetical protein
MALTSRQRAAKRAATEDNNNNNNIGIAVGSGVRNTIIKKTSPSEAAINNLMTAVQSLPQQLQIFLTDDCKEILHLFNQLENRRNTNMAMKNGDKIPSSARIQFKLQVAHDTAMSEKFKALSEECNNHIIEFQLYLKQQIIASKELEIDDTLQSLLVKIGSVINLFGTAYYRYHMLDMTATMDNIELRTITKSYIQSINNANCMYLRIPDAQQDIISSALDTVFGTVGDLNYDTADPNKKVIRDNILKYLDTVITTSLLIFKQKTTEQFTTRELNKLYYTNKLDTATAAAAMEIDNTPAATPANIKELINKEVAKRVANELKKKIRPSNSQSSKNKDRGANNNTNKNTEPIQQPPAAKTATKNKSRASLKKKKPQEEHGKAAGANKDSATATKRKFGKQSKKKSNSKKGKKGNGLNRTSTISNRK